MKRILILLIIFLLIFQVHVFGDDHIPSSRRSQKAISRVKPILIASLLNKKLNYGSPVFIRIFKESSELEFWIKQKNKYKLFKTYPICYFSGNLGPKLRRGDLQSPEGFYFVKPSRLNPYSQFHLSFNLGYPNAYDRSHKRTGGFLMVHGDCVSIGCYAMTDKNIEEIYALIDAALRNGQTFFRVHIFPFRMTDKNLKQHQKSKWYSFWKNLKQGYDMFENQLCPPNVRVQNKQYIFESTCQ